MKKEQTHILYVEDDETLSLITKENLESHGYLVDHAPNGSLAYNLSRQKKYDLYVLDVMLPEMDGFTLAEKIREKDADVPILFLSAKSMKEDKIQGLKIGGDDYITKPFSIEELILRIEVFLKRNKISNPSGQREKYIGDYLFDYSNLSIIKNGAEIVMTQREADLLNYLLQRKNQVVKRSLILEAIWGEDDYFLGRSLDVFISRLRKHFVQDESIKIENIHGVGFRLKC